MNSTSVLTPTKALIILYIYIGIYFAVALQAASANPTLWHLWTTLCPILTGILATVAATWAWRATHQPTSGIWRWLALGIGVWTLAEIVSALLTAIGDQAEAYGFMADGLWLFGYLLVGAAIRAQLSHSAQHLKWPAVGLGLAIGFGFVLIVGMVVLRPMYEGLALGSGLQLALNLIYPIADAMLAAGGLMAMQATKGDGRWNPWWSVGIACLLLAYSDLCFSTLNWIGAYGFNAMRMLTVDIPYGLAYLFVAAGCLQSVSFTQPVNVSPAIGKAA